MARKAVALISGGLDSILAARVVMDQGYEVTGLYFTSAFSKAFGHEQNTHAARVSEETGIALRIIDLGQEYIDLIRDPRHGYGKNINPCIDCKIFMLQKARSVMEELGSPFIITGEVLGQRPMSQRRDTLNVIERDSGLRGRILRPLSALVMPPTQAELDGLVERSRLLGFSGRGRTAQFKLAERFGIRGFSAPAGGCLLTDENFSEKLRDLFQEQERVIPLDIRLLTVGRHFKVSPGVRIVLGRDRRENEVLAEIASPGYHLLEPFDFMGPAAILTGAPTEEMKILAGRLIVTYSKKISGMMRKIRFNEETFTAGPPLESPESSLKRIGAN
ncbi:MAG: hypothetical protein OEW15_10460 [Nitrospirota bacterium]|nr:hypothetical protein [Nitrospirota bacterium]